MKKRAKLATKLIVIFGLTLFFSVLIFFAFFSVAASQSKKNLNREQQRDYLDYILAANSNPDYIQPNEHNGYIVFNAIGDYYHSENLNELIGSSYTIKDLKDLFNNGNDSFFNYQGKNNIYFMGSKDRGKLVLTFNAGTFKDSKANTFNNMVISTFILIFFASNSILLVWTRRFIQRIAVLQDQVSNLRNDNYEAPIEQVGHDEIGELAYTIEGMRQQIFLNEKVKQEMLQNLSHDLKTPIAVIQSYAEAIADGIADESATGVILKQTELLTHKVTQMLRLNKIEYIKDEKNNEDVVLSELIKLILNEYKYRIEVEVSFEYDDSSYVGIKEDYYIAFQNILDNALRYAEKKIEITIKDQVITFYNDGSPLPQSIIKANKFKAYEKGERGQFGLGMIIVQKTVDKYNLKLLAENKNGGVMFTIMPR